MLRSVPSARHNVRFRSDSEVMKVSLKMTKALMRKTTTAKYPISKSKILTLKTKKC